MIGSAVFGRSSKSSTRTWTISSVVATVSTASGALRISSAQPVARRARRSARTARTCERAVHRHPRPRRVERREPRSRERRLAAAGRPGDQRQPAGDGRSEPILQPSPLQDGARQRRRHEGDGRREVGTRPSAGVGHSPTVLTGSRSCPVRYAPRPARRSWRRRGRAAGRALRAGRRRRQVAGHDCLGVHRQVAERPGVRRTERLGETDGDPHCAIVRDSVPCRRHPIW